MQKCLSIFVFFLSTSIFAQHQKVIFGLLHFKNDPGNGFFIQAVNPETNNTITFSTSNKNGAYCLKITPEYQNIKIVISQIGFQKIDTLIVLANDSTELSFNLISIQRLLPEVHVFLKKEIEIAGDTTSYNVAAFKKNEKNIEELLKKLPGIEVNEKGEIKFKNKTIKTILLDGDNVVQNNYQVLSKNLTPEMVDKIQVIENYSSNELLKGIETGSETVLNLAINKNFKGVIYNKTEGLSTIKDSLHLINNLSLSLFKNSKVFNVFDKNNIGKYNSTGSIGGAYNFSADLTNSLLDNSYLNSLLAQDASKFNNSIFDNFNFFTKRKGKFESSFQYTYFIDRQKFKYSNVATYLNANPVFTFIENIQNSIRVKTDCFNFNTKVFTSKRSFLLFTIEQKYAQSIQYKNTANTFTKQENCNSDTVKLQNYTLYFIQKLKPTLAFEAEIFYRAKKNIQELVIMPGVYKLFFSSTYTSIEQPDYCNENITGNEIRLKSYSSWGKYGFNLGCLYKTSKYLSTINLLDNLNSSTPDSLSNSAIIKTKSFYFSNRVEKNITYKVSFIAENKLSANNISEESIKKNNVFYNSVMSIKAKTGMHGSFNFSFNNSSDYINDKSYLKNYYFKKYNTLIKNVTSNFIVERKQEYKIDYTAVDFFKNQQIILLSIGLVNKQSPLSTISENYSDFSIQKSQALEKNINTENLMSYFFYSRLLQSLKSRISFSNLILRIKTKTLNENPLANNLISNIVTSELGLSSKFNGFWNYEFKFGFRYNQNKAALGYLNNSFSNSMFNISLKMNAKIKKNLNAEGSIKVIKNNSTVCYADIDLEYSFPKKNLVISIGGQNLLNNGEVVSYFSNEYYTQKSQSVVFPRFIYVGVKHSFSFKL